MRIQRIIVEAYIFIGIARLKPRFLYRDAVVFGIERQLARLRLEHPVVAVVGDGADELSPGDDVYGELEIVDEPILGGDRPRRRTGIVFIVVHDHHAVGRPGDRGIVEFQIVRGHTDVKLHPAAMQVRGKFVQQRKIARLPYLGESLKIHHQSAETIGGKHHRHLLAKDRAGSRIIQKIRDSPHPLRTVKVVHHGKNFHGGVFRLEKRHHAVVDGAHAIVFDHVEELVGLVVHPLQTAVGGEHVQPVGIQQIDLAGVIAERRETSGVPGYVESRANALFLV